MSNNKSDNISYSERGWPFAGQNLHNTRNQSQEKRINANNVHQLAPKWVFTMEGDVSANPAVQKDELYVPDWAGYLYKINSETGELLWKHSISEYTGIANSVSRTTPTITDNSIIIGDQNGGHLIAVDKHTGERKWITQLDPHVAAVITQSPVVYGDRVFVGVSSSEEGLAVNPNYPCCSFRGSMLVLDKDCGKILWKTFTVPEGYSGGAVWSSTPVIDTKRNLVYVTTGNNYDVPEVVKECIKLKGLENADACMAEDNYVDAFIAFDMDTGEIKWARRVQGYDAWTVACIIQVPWCPDPAGPDYDFGAGPNLFSVTIDGKKQDVIGAGQKSGVYWALNPDNGEILWNTLVGPGGTLGGIEWGTAVDSERIYAAVANTNRIPHELTSGEVTPGGSWSALDQATGEILWQTADPLENLLTGPLSVANGVVYGGSMDPEGHMYALDAETGEILWSYKSGGSVNSAPSIVDGTLYWGSGYSRLDLGTPNNKLFAFSLSKNNKC